MLRMRRDVKTIVFPGYDGGPQLDAQELSDEDAVVNYTLGPGLGGIVQLQANLSNSEYHHFMERHMVGAECPKHSLGTEIGNEAGMQLQRMVDIWGPYCAPALAIRFGLAKRIRHPKIPVTAEHVVLPERKRLILVLPKSSRKKVAKWLDGFGRLLKHFGVTSEKVDTDCTHIRPEVATWFSDPQREMIFLSASGGANDCAWQLGVLTYCAQLIDVECGGVQGVHLLDEIEDKPNFRPHWTSNR